MDVTVHAGQLREVVQINDLFLALSSMRGHGASTCTTARALDLSNEPRETSTKRTNEQATSRRCTHVPATLPRVTRATRARKLICTARGTAIKGQEAQSENDECQKERRAVNLDSCKRSKPEAPSTPRRTFGLSDAFKIWTEIKKRREEIPVLVTWCHVAVIEIGARAEALLSSRCWPFPHSAPVVTAAAPHRTAAATHFFNTPHRSALLERVSVLNLTALSPLPSPALVLRSLSQAMSGLPGNAQSTHARSALPAAPPVCLATHSWRGGWGLVCSCLR